MIDSTKYKSADGRSWSGRSLALDGGRAITLWTEDESGGGQVIFARPRMDGEEGGGDNKETFVTRAALSKEALDALMWLLMARNSGAASAAWWIGDWSLAVGMEKDDAES